MSWRPYLRSIFSEAARAVLPICLLLIILKAVFLGLTASSSDAFLLGMRGTLLLSAGVLLIVFGLSFFLQGLEHSLLPLGRTVGSMLPQTARLWSIMLFALVLGALATIAEPDLKVYVDKTIGLLGGRVGRTGLMAAVAGGAQAVTITHGRGMGVREKLKFLGVAIHPEKEILFTVVPAHLTDRVFEAVFKAGRIGEPGMGFIFVQEVRRASGWLSDDLKSVT